MLSTLTCPPLPRCTPCTGGQQTAEEAAAVLSTLYDEEATRRHGRQPNLQAIEEELTPKSNEL